MQILTISDEVVPMIYGPSIKKQFSDVQMILSCGDLRPSYLEYIVSSLNVPSFYVPGNHDGEPEHTECGESLVKPNGWVSVHGRVVHSKGLSIAGLGGSIWYNGGPYQYSESEMLLRVMLLYPRVLLRQHLDGHPLDILITHSPPAGIQDGPRAHRGFQALVYLMERIKPRYLIHGHVHKSYGYNRTLTSLVGTTTVINTVGYRLVEVEPVIQAETGQTRTVR